MNGLNLSDNFIGCKKGKKDIKSYYISREDFTAYFKSWNASQILKILSHYATYVKDTILPSEDK
jgi:hypothetical protein